MQHTVISYPEMQEIHFASVFVGEVVWGKGGKLGYGRLGFQPLTMRQGAASFCPQGSLVTECTLLPPCEVRNIIVRIV